MSARRPGNAHAVLARKFRAATKNSCDAVVAEFFAGELRSCYRNAFRTKARSHCPITSLSGRLKSL
jgi:hypothetical protein